MNPTAPLKLSAWLLVRRARRRRQHGRYDRHTLRLFHRAAGSGSAAALLEYVLFRRDLGYPMHPRFIEPLLERRAELPPRKRWLAAALLTELGAEPGMAWDDVEPGCGLTSAARNQHNWRDGFKLALEAAERGICVVGNSAHLAGRALGERIDAASLVVRFNDFPCGEIYVPDVGHRTSVWVTSPGYEGPPFLDADWVVVTGPDMCFRLRHWGALSERLRRARPVLSVPLPIWRELVRTLHAPPSAGVLMLAWLHSLLGSWNTVTAVGIGTGNSGRYRIQVYGRRSSRHDWRAEAALVRDWAREGLQTLPAPTGGSAPHNHLVGSLS